MRKALGFISSLAILSVVVWGVAALIEAKHIHKNLGGDIFFTAVLSLVLTAGIGGIGASLIWPWMFPAFELYGEGGTSSGGRRLAALGAFALSTIGGILVALFT
jgi:hypothetical protein